MYFKKLIDFSCLFFVGILFSVIYISFANGAVHCIKNPSLPIVNTVNLTPQNIYAGADMPNGTIIYRGQWIPKQTNVVTCSGPVGEKFFFTIEQKITQAPLPLSSWSGSPYGGSVYQSGIPGIGVVLLAGDKAPVTLNNPVITSTGNWPIGPSGSTTVAINDALLNQSAILLIKIGDIQPGNYTLNSANIPTLEQYSADNGTVPPISENPVSIATINYAGSLVINSTTCTTPPNILVPMGKYPVNDFLNVGSTSPWININLRLTDCPFFYGYYNNSIYPILFNANNNGSASIPTSIGNSMGIRLSPSSVIDGSLGIMDIDLDPVVSASGVGIQIGWMNSSITPFDFSEEKIISLPKIEGANIDIPLFARYIKTESAMKPGRADGKLIFMINYY